MNEAFSQADRAQLHWQTSHFYIAGTERDLLRPMRSASEGRLLEIGCGQGANLFHLQSMGFFSLYGVDLSVARLKVLRSFIKGVHVVCADAHALPFRNAVFGDILVRDVLHHVSSPETVLQEIGRMMRASGQIYVLEPNGKNPIMKLWAVVARFDREILNNSPTSLGRLFEKTSLRNGEVFFFQPFPISRVLFHYRWGLGNFWSWLAPLVRGFEGFMGHFLPRKRSAYLGYLFKGQS